MARLRKRVVTIHGVNPDRRWQEAARRVLEPHFEVVSLEYRGYDGIQGPIRVVCHPVALVGAVAVLGGVLVGWVGWSVEWSVGVWWAAGIFVGGVGVAAYQRRREGKRVKRLLSDVCAKPPRPHVIAHSFGTYLVGRALLHPDIELGRVVLIGSVLPRWFKWALLRLNGREGFGEVRNEMGTRDFAVWVAGRVRWLARDIGDAGLRGFVGNGTHSTKGPWASCAECGDLCEEGSVHNVPLEEMEHSDSFLGQGHVRWLWLPYLWGLPAGEFKRFEDLCWDAAYSVQEGVWWRVELLLGELGESKWSWTSSRSLSEYVGDCVDRERKRRGPGEGREGVGLGWGTKEEAGVEVLRVMSLYVARASVEDEEDERIRRALYPPYAVVAAVKSVLGGEGGEWARGLFGG